MTRSNDLSPNNYTSYKKRNEGHSVSIRARERLIRESSHRPKPARSFRYRSLVRILIILLIVLVIFATVHLSSVLTATDDQLLVQLGHTATTIDLRQSSPISPYLLGTNAFAAVDTSSVDQPFDGFMNYSAPIANGLRDAHMKLLRFPGGASGEDHLLSYDQLNAFSVLLSQVGADGMIQTRLSGTVGTAGQYVATLEHRANLAGTWVDYMNNIHSSFRTGKYAHAPYHRVEFWSVGNEPDQLINPDTGKIFTVAEYVNAFIQFSIAMHHNDPAIQVFGPELSQFNGVGVGPKDSNGQLWMEGFLQGVHAYEVAHPELKTHLLDGVSIHYYPFTDATRSPSELLSTPNEWNYLLPPLRQLIQQDFGRDIPVAVTEINSSPTTQISSRGMSALWWADTLGTLMNQQTAYVAFFATEGVDTPYPLFTSDGLHETPMFRVMQLFSHLQDNLISMESQDPFVTMYATQNDAHDTVSLLLVNNSSTTEFAQVSPQNQFFGFSNWHPEDISLYRYSITVVTLHRSGGAEAYVYKVPAVEDASVAPLSYTVCGHQTDVLVNDKPC